MWLLSIDLEVTGVSLAAERKFKVAACAKILCKDPVGGNARCGDRRTGRSAGVVNDVLRAVRKWRPDRGLC